MRGLRLLLLVLALAIGGVAYAQTAAFTATVTAESTDLRKNANGLAPSIDTVLKGTQLPAFGLSPDKKWVRVRAPDGTTVWIARNDVKVAKTGAATAESAPTPTPKPAKTATATTTPKPVKGLGGDKKVAHVVVEKTKLQLNASKSAPTLTMARRNDEFEVGGFSRDGLWVRVRTTDGRVGFIQKTDVRPGPAPAGGAVAVATPKPRPTPKPNDGFDDPNSGFSDEPVEEAPVRRRRVATASDMTIYADGGVVLINETMTSNEGFGYNLNAMGYGLGVRVERKLMGDNLFLDGGYLGTGNQRIPAPESTTTVFSTLHRIDVAAKYKFYFIDEEGPAIFGVAGFQNYTFFIQPQNLSWFYSQIYNSGAVGLGGEYPFGDWRVVGDFRYFVPVLASQRYGSGGAGGDGQSNSATGYSIGLGIRKSFYSGASLGLSYRGHFYETVYSGTGKRGPNDVSGVVVKDTFSAITLNYARGF